MPIGWKLNLYDHAEALVTNQGHLEPIGLEFEMNISETGTFSSGISLRDKRYIKHDWVSPFEHDFKLVINDGITYKDQVLMEGIITSHNVKAEAEICGIAGNDYLGYFDRRGYPFDPALRTTFQVQWDVDTDIGQIVNDIITVVLAQDHTDFSPTLSIPPVGVSQSGYRIAYGDSSNLTSLIQGFSNGYPGFEYAFKTPKTFTVYPLEFDTTHTAVYRFEEDENGALQGVVDGPEWTNNGPGGTHAAGQGAGTATQLWQNYAYVPSEERYRRLDIFPSFGDLINVLHIQRATAGALGIALAPIYEITMTVNPDFVITTNGFWNDFVPGAYVFIHKDLKAHMLDGLYKIVQMHGAVDVDGQCLVTLNMNRETDLSLVFSDTTP